MKTQNLFCFFIFVTLLSKIQSGEGLIRAEDTGVRVCSDPDNIYLPPTATNTTLRLMDFRNEMDKSNISAYIVPSSDAHLSEYVASRDRKRQWITGFTGSAGTAVITMDKAAVWTDGRYFVQAERQLDCNWILMKMDEPGVPSVEEWILSELNPESKVGAHPFLFSVGEWQNYEQEFARKQLTFEEVIPDFIDLIWEDRPELSSDPLLILSTTYTGKDWKTKLADARIEMTNKGSDYLLLTRLDEIAWFFNMRGNDVPNTPVFTSYVIVSLDGDINLYGKESLFEDELVQDHINGENCGDSCVIIRPYEEARNDLLLLAADQNNMIWLPDDSTTYGMFSAVNQVQQISTSSPLRIVKSVKNPTEISAMKQTHIYDAVALCEYLMWLETNVPLGSVSEISGAEVLKNLRLDQPTNQGLSFGSISASGPNGAVIHYGATPETNRNLSINEMYMVDSGGQYLGGTTDVTRAIHCGEPTDFEKETFTLALMGMLDVQMSVFAYTKKARELDVLARQHLYKAGLDYRHRTGHGIGQFLCIHEYPPGFGTSTYEDYALQPGMFTSIEPGYYHTGSFGLRHENINVVVEAVTKYQFEDYKFYTFEPVTLVPFQSKLIDLTLMSEAQITYLNEYHQKVREIIGAEARRQNKPELSDWIDSATVQLGSGSSVSVSKSITLIVTAFFVTLITREQLL